MMIGKETPMHWKKCSIVENGGKMLKVQFSFHDVIILARNKYKLTLDGQVTDFGR